VPFDDVAHGRIRDWTLTTLRTRLPEMLRHSGAFALASSVDPTAVSAAVDHIESITAPGAR
jgi:hypothetical protein